MNSFSNFMNSFSNFMNSFSIFMNGFLNVSKKEIVWVWPKMVAEAKEWGDKGPRTPEKRD